LRGQQTDATFPIVTRKRKRKGKTVTFSVSVDPRTKKLLRDVADRAYRGNVSELIAQIAEQAARQEAALSLLVLHGRPSMSDAECEAFERELAAELSAQPSGKKRRRRAA
jgi:hypothetical protein